MPLVQYRAIVRSGSGELVAEFYVDAEDAKDAQMKAIQRFEELHPDKHVEQHFIRVHAP